MGDRAKWLVTIQVTESFGTTLADLAHELQLGVAEVGPGCPPPPSGVIGMVVLAGGSEAEGLEVLDTVESNGIPRWVVGASTDHRLASAAIRRGGTDYFALPEDLDLLRRTIARAAAEATAADARDQFVREERSSAGFDAIVGRSPALRQILDQARRIATHPDITVLLGGETGTGKELLARAIHYHSPRAEGPFVEINCAAIPANLLESELFGHTRGAFTGAIADKAGLFELADGGTLFLDEIGTLPLDLQPKILRALESRTIRRVGGATSTDIDVRVVSATHIDLAEAVRTGEFREDLYYRLNVIALHLPPLRDRDADVEVLAETFLVQLATRYELPIPPLTPELRASLRSHPWKGNVRELRNAIERALVLSPPGTLTVPDLRPPPPTPSHEWGPLPFPASMHAISRAAALAMLELAKGNKSEAARKLGISRPRLQRLLTGDPE